MRPWPIAILLLGTWMLHGPAHGEGPGPSDARKIVDQALTHMVFRSKGADMTITMTLRSKQGETRTRTLFTRSSREGDLARTLVRVVSPSDVAGMAFLFVENKGREDDQHLYMPALKVVRRIAGQQKGQSFMGSDFTYHDLEWQDLSEATHRLLPEEKVGEAACHVVESVPRERSEYGKVIAWIRKSDNVLLRLRFFDTKGELFKTLFIKEIKKIQNVQVVTKAKMENHRTGHATFLEIGNIRMRDDISAEEFTVRALTKG